MCCSAKQIAEYRVTNQLQTHLRIYCPRLALHHAPEFETAAAAGGWQPFLLPGSDEAASPQVSAMLGEVRHMVDTAAFNIALRVRCYTPTHFRMSAAGLVPMPIIRWYGKPDAMPAARLQAA